MADIQPIGSSQTADSAQLEPKPAAKPWNELVFQIDVNAGMYNLARKKPNGPADGWYGTSNLFLNAIFMPKELLGKYAGLLFKGGAWFRTTDFNPTFEKSIMRLYFGPAGYVQWTDGAHRVRFLASPNYFYGFDLNSGDTKHWRSHEFGVYSSLSYDYLSEGVHFDVHNWFVYGLDITLPKGMKADESGGIFGSTLSWKPFRKTGIPFVESMEFYGRYRYWGWKVQPEGVTADRKWWHEVTGGLKASIGVDCW
jgi:hypothetical protein